MKGEPGASHQIYLGVPQFTEDFDYIGPIPRVSAKERGLTTLARGANETKFRTTGTAAWPVQLDEWAAQSIHTTAINSRLQQGLDQTAGIAEGRDQTAGIADSAAKLMDGASDSIDSAAELYPTTIPPENYWVGGHGDARKTFALGKTYNFHDGAGLTSPGRWNKESRKYPEGKAWDNLRNRLLETQESQGRKWQGAGVNRDP
jgi:hypothetical protein